MPRFPTSAVVLALLSTGCLKQSAESSSAPIVAPARDVSAAPLGTRAGPEPVASNPSPGADAGASEMHDDEARIAREHSRGLGTSFGEQRSSAVVDAPFVRESNAPDALLSLAYNDLDGVRTAAGRLGARANLESRVSTGDGLLAITLVDDAGRSLPAADLDGRRYVIGNQGAAYRIGVENHSRDRFEVVGSVDGLDVIDGEQAALHKRGYIVEPFSSVVIDGWRTSNDTVAAFRFASIEDSYADRKGAPRDIGVIGVAFFGERSARAPIGDDIERRHHADPFPGRFAAPPRR